MLPLNLLLAVVGILGNTYAHGGADHKLAGESNEQYAQRHMASEHHIDAFDLASFFKLHDLNRDNIWDREEIEAVYGVHHVYSQAKSADEEQHKKKADTIVNTVLAKLDKDRDGKISLAELEAQGLDALPSFAHLGADGHHYDVESEFFLHHEEIFHSTPETQTDESYNHPEDLEHFAQHEAIEAEEMRRERQYQGLPPEEDSSSMPSTPQEAQAKESSESETNDSQPVEQVGKVVAPPPSNMGEHPHDDSNIAGEHMGEHPFYHREADKSNTANKPKVTRVRHPDAKEPIEVYADAFKEGRDKMEWGQGDQGYKRPKTPADKLRKNIPYKYKFRKNWGDF